MRLAVALYAALLVAPLAHGYLLPGLSLSHTCGLVAVARAQIPRVVCGTARGAAARRHCAVAGAGGGAAALVAYSEEAAAYAALARRRAGMVTQGHAAASLTAPPPRLRTDRADHPESGRTGFVAYPWPAAEDGARRARFRLPSALSSPERPCYRVTLFDASDADCSMRRTQTVLVESLPGPSERPSDESVRQEVALMLELIHTLMLEAHGDGKTMAVLGDFTSLPRPQVWPSIAMKLRGFGECLLKGFEQGIPVAEATVVLPRLDMLSRRLFIPPAQQLAARLGLKLAIVDKAQGGDTALASKKRALGISSG